MRIGYNTNGFAYHRLEDAIAILAETGYESVAITIDHHALNPADPALPDQRSHIAALLKRHSLHCVIETGARFLLDPRRKHSPTLLDEEPRSRIRREFLERAIQLARDLDADAVSFWSGAKPEGLSDQDAMNRLADACRSLAEFAGQHGVRLAFEPEPGMFVDRMDLFEELHRHVNHPSFGLTLDVGHVHCLGDGDVCSHIRRWRHILFNVHIEDMRRGVHEHLPFGHGDMDIPAILTCLRDIGYLFGVHVELPRHSHDAPRIAREAFDYLRRLPA